MKISTVCNPGVQTTLRKRSDIKRFFRGLRGPGKNPRILGQRGFGDKSWDIGDGDPEVILCDMARLRVNFDATGIDRGKRRRDYTEVPVIDHFVCVLRVWRLPALTTSHLVSPDALFGKDFPIIARREV